MSDSPATSFALGYIAAGIGDDELQRSIRGLFAPRTVAVDPVYLQQLETVNQRFEVHFASQEQYVAGLQREIKDVRAGWRQAEAHRDELKVYAQGLEAERDRLKALADDLTAQRVALKAKLLDLEIYCGLDVG